ncbi:pre-mRNA-splicing factor CWC25 homolog [Phlebotomus argentipes]|uniref:pre-mRNA-splicing factor CWC25 homolog n=1 Tax=Phlebotomus argentipes TaxID=94469 RepID=UPI0028937EDC|nr:pre-mRNA-splicing factor CWC25 homolog [Phlebotomus argentipes]
MGGGDLNAKKSWHPNTLKNQERVWKVEQADAAEKRKMAELQKEISEERSREELKKIAHTSGVIDMGEDKKLEWMYKGPTELVNREEYLLGRPVDKTFEQLTAEADNQLIGVTVPKNHVEHECIPFSIRAFRGTQGGEQVDMARKIMEDPLMAIKQKEMESRRKILENPVKLKELHRLLKKDQPKSSKKSKKKDKKKRKRRRSSSSDSDGGDLDALLAKKYKKIQSVINDEKGEANLDLNQLLEDKYDKLSKELDKMGSKKKHSKRKRSPSPVRSRRVMDDDEGSSRIVTKNYGLVSADGKSIRIEGKHRREERSRPSETETSSRKAKAWTRPERQRLTEAEKEAKRREMMDNAVWRDRERERNVRRYREDDRVQKAREEGREFDRNFINKELHKAVSRETVESRIKSNVNNIQRSSHSMNANFARR